jgi:membrane-associated phospholipid phosphatase
VVEDREAAAESAEFTAARLPPANSAHEPGWRRVRFGAYGTYVATLLAIVFAYGLPTRRPVLALLIIVGLALTSIGRGWHATTRVIVDWLPFSAVLIAYDQTRKVVDTLGTPLHEADILRAERWCFGGTEPTLWLQQHLYHPTHVYWYEGLITLVYTSHFFATPVLAAVLWVRNRALWLRYISRVVVLAVAGLVTYCLVPEAPPWLAARDGLTEPVARLSARGWMWLGAPKLDDLLADAQHDGANPVAAMPSLHFAFAILVALMIGISLRTRWRYLLALYPAAMGFTLVYTGEHYVLDLVAGLAYALVVHVAVSRWEARRAGRRLAPQVPTRLDDLDERERATRP